VFEEDEIAVEEIVAVREDLVDEDDAEDEGEDDAEDTAAEAGDEGTDDADGG
jgi:hypothetical protein